MLVSREGGLFIVCVHLQAVVLEGKYWKRRDDAVASEYRKWRFYREKKNVSAGQNFALLSLCLRQVFEYYYQRTCSQEAIPI